MKARLSVVPSCNTPAVDLLGDFETWLRSWGASDNTVRVRLSVLGVGISVWGDPLMVQAPALMAWLASPAYSPWTRMTYYHHLKSLFGYLEDSGLINRNPVCDLRVPRTPKDLPRPLTAMEATRALTAASGNLRTWLLLGMLAGLRAHEIAKIQGQDVTEETMFVLGKGQQQAFIPTHPELWSLAQSYPSRGYWFPSRPGCKLPHVTSTSVSTMVTRLFKSLGIDGSSHRCRHTYATNLLRNGANIRVVQTLMRHENLATTARYTAVDDDERMSAIRTLNVA